MSDKSVQVYQVWVNGRGFRVVVVKVRGIAFVDSTALRVCENIGIPRHKTFTE